MADNIPFGDVVGARSGLQCTRIPIDDILASFTPLDSPSFNEVAGVLRANFPVLPASPVVALPAASLYPHGRCRAIIYSDGFVDDTEAEFVSHVGALFVTLIAAYSPAKEAGESDCSSFASPTSTSLVRPVIVCIHRNNCALTSTDQL